jgi:hypothetical protein
VANDDPQLILPMTPEQSAAEQPNLLKKPARRRSAPAASEDGQGSLF